MSFTDEKTIDITTYCKEAAEHRKNHWQNLFDKYEIQEVDNNEDDEAIIVEDIVNKFGKNKRLRKCTEASDTKICNTKRRRCETVLSSTQKGACSKIRGKSGRSELQSKENTETDDEKECFIKLEKNVEASETFPKKRGRPFKKNNTTMKVKEADAKKNSRIKPVINTENIDELDDKTLVENEIKNTSIITQNMAVRKRGRKPYKNITPNHNTSVDNPVKNFIKNKVNLTSVPSKVPPLLNRNLKYKQSSVAYEKIIVDAFSMKELEKVYPNLVKIENRLSRSYTVPKLKKYNLRSRSCIDYDDKSFKFLHLFCEKNKNSNSTAKKNTLLKLAHSSPRRRKQFNKTLNHTVDTIHEKGNHEQYAKDKSSNDISQFKTGQPVLDQDLLHTKFIIEEKLKSNVGLLMIKRLHILNSTAEDKEKNFTLWHNAVKNEMIKLYKIISMEKLEQYIQWYVTTWFSQANN